MEQGWQTRPSGEGQCVMRSRSELGSVFDTDVPAGHIKANYYCEEILPVHHPPHIVGSSNPSPNPQPFSGSWQHITALSMAWWQLRMVVPRFPDRFPSCSEQMEFYTPITPVTLAILSPLLVRESEIDRKREEEKANTHPTASRSDLTLKSFFLTPIFA